MRNTIATVMLVCSFAAQATAERPAPPMSTAPCTATYIGGISSPGFGFGVDGQVFMDEECRTQENLETLRSMVSSEAHFRAQQAFERHTRQQQEEAQAKAKRQHVFSLIVLHVGAVSILILLLLLGLSLRKLSEDTPRRPSVDPNDVVAGHTSKISH